MIHGPLIDTHQHPIPDYYKRALAKVGIHGSGENPWADWSVSAQLEMMDKNGIAVAINSIASPGVYFGDIEFAVRLARECNENSAHMVADHPIASAHLQSCRCPMSELQSVRRSTRSTRSSSKASVY